MKVGVNAGGCWFCDDDDDRSTWSISCEFDTSFHDSCYEKAKKTRTDPEMMIIIEEYERIEKRFKQQSV